MAEQTTNFLSPLGFQLGVTKLPGVGFYAQQVNLPGLSLPEATQATPFVDAPVPGEKLVFEPFTMNFMIDERMDNFIAVYDWLISLGFPNDYTEFLDGRNRNLIHMSDAFLQILGAQNTVIRTLKFKDMFPINLGAITFQSTDQDVQYISAQADFRYTSFTIA